MRATLTSAERKYHEQFSFTTEAPLHIAHLLFGDYLLSVAADGFEPSVQRLHVASAVPIETAIALRVAALQQRVDVHTRDALVETERASPGTALGRTQLQNKMTAQPGRELIDVVADQPGWILEANGVLHPRGAEYETQIVINGVPRTENLSPAFAAPLPVNEVESAEVRTAGIPAEFGRSLGGVIDITTAARFQRGWHGDLSASGGSFAAAAGDGALGYGTTRQQLGLFAQVYRTDRYLDPPVLPNFRNVGDAHSTRADEQIEVTTRDRIEIDFAEADLHFQVPNEAVQQRAGKSRSGRARNAPVVLPGSTPFHRIA